MDNQVNGPLQVVFVVTCYQNILGIYANQEDAAQIQRDFLLKNRPADIVCRSVVYSLNS